MQGDDIRSHRVRAEEDATGWTVNEDSTANYLLAHQALALWVVAEQIFEFRENLGILIYRLEKREKP